MKNKIVILTAILSVVLIISPIGAQALPIVFNLDQSNVFLDGQTYATVQIDFETANKAIFSVDVNESLLIPVVGGSYGIDKFFINTELDLTITNFSAVQSWSIQEDKQASEFGKFSLLYKGQGNDRHDPLIFTINFNGISVDDFIPNTDGYTFATHIANFTYAGVAYGNNSAFFANGSTPVPEPTTAFLLGIGLIGLVAVGRKKLFKKQSQ